MSTDKNIMRILREAKRLAREYYSLTGKPLGVTGEVAEYEAARILDVKLTPARQSGYDAVESRGGKQKRLQIKGRCLQKDCKPGQRLGSIRTNKEWDAVLMVLLDHDFEATEIYEAQRPAVLAALAAPGSKSRNERGALSVSKFKSIGTLRWSKPVRRPKVVRGIKMFNTKMKKREAIVQASQQHKVAELDNHNTHFSKINTRKNVWWLDIPFRKVKGPEAIPFLHLLLYDYGVRRLHYLKVQTDFLKRNLSRLVTRKTKKTISLELSADSSKLFQDVRPTGRGVRFMHFRQ